MVGVVATATYFLVANILLWGAKLHPASASVLGYLTAMIVSFVGQSRFTFLLGKTDRLHLVRFLILSAVGLTISYASVWLCERLEVHPFWALVATSILIPILSFVTMKVWVFARH